MQSRFSLALALAQLVCGGGGGSRRCPAARPGSLWIATNAAATPLRHCGCGYCTPHCALCGLRVCTADCAIIATCNLPQPCISPPKKTATKGVRGPPPLVPSPFASASGSRPRPRCPRPRSRPRLTAHGSRLALGASPGACGCWWLVTAGVAVVWGWAGAIGKPGVTERRAARGWQLAAGRGSSQRMALCFGRQPVR
jgi:hypothetical protein